MLDEKGFDLWAEGYDRSVGLSDEDGSYPFAGYRDLLNGIYRRILSSESKSVLDIGFGTGTLTKRLYDHGCAIFGQDFSEKMISLAQAKMPEAHLVQWDFSLGIAPVLKQNRYDAIVATYSLHHLTDAQKESLIRELLSLLTPAGCLYIGDVAFTTREDLERCRREAGEDWDEDEIYFVADEMAARFPQMKFEPFSHCAGLLTLKP